MDPLQYLSLIALFAALLKILILVQSMAHSPINAAVILVTRTLILQNILEFILLFTFGYSQQFVILLIGTFLFVSTLVAATMLNLVLTVTQSKYIRISQLILVVPIIIVCILLIQGSIYTGYELNGLSFISRPGPAYPLYQGLILSVAIIATFILCKGSISSNSVIAIRSRRTLLAASPIIATSITVIVLRLIGINASATFVMPISSTFFVWVLLQDERGDFVVFKMKWIRVWFYFRQALKNAFSSDSVSLKEFKEDTEKTILLEALKLSNYNMSAAARILGTSHSSISRKVKKYNFEDPSNMTLSKVIEQSQYNSKIAESTDI